MNFAESVLPREAVFVPSANKTRAKFDALASPEVSSAAIRTIRESSTVPGSRNFASSVVDFLRQKHLFGKYRNNDTGWDDINIGSSTVKSIIHHGGRDGKIALIEAAPDLIRNGILLETNPKKQRWAYKSYFCG